MYFIAKDTALQNKPRVFLMPPLDAVNNRLDVEMPTTAARINIEAGRALIWAWLICLVSPLLDKDCRIT